MEVDSSLAYACIRRDPKGKLFIDLDTIDFTEQFCKVKIRKKDDAYPAYCKDHPQVRIDRVQVTLWERENGMGEFD